MQKEEEAAAGTKGQEAEQEVPEWVRYQQQRGGEKRFRFKKGKGKKAADEEAEEVRWGGAAGAAAI